MWACRAESGVKFLQSRSRGPCWNPVHWMEDDAMAANSSPRITPYLLYEDVDAMLDWLAAAFGFRERERQRRPDGKTVHAEMTLGDDGLILLGWPGPTYQNPKHLGQATQNLYVFVADIDRHFQRARAAG